MKKSIAVIAATIAVALVGCANPTRPAHTSGNYRPMGHGPTGADLVKKCIYAVRFNEDEASVRETDYMDATYCMGVMDGMAGANELERERGPGNAVYCLPAPMKPWLEAKVIVDYAKARPDLLALQEVHYAMLAMAASYPCALFIGIAPQENPGQSALSPGERCRNEGQVQLSGVKGKGWVHLLSIRYIRRGRHEQSQGNSCFVSVFVDAEPGGRGRRSDVG